MSNSFLLPNNINTTLASPVTSSGQTTIVLTDATYLPASIPTGYVMPITVRDAATKLVNEIMWATPQTISGATLTVLRGQENTTAQSSWSAGDLAYSGPTAAALLNFQQATLPVVGNPLTFMSLQNTQTNNFSSSTQISGTSYTIPANALVQGAIIRVDVKAGITTTGNPTLGVQMKIGGNGSGDWTTNAFTNAGVGSNVSGWFEYFVNTAGSSGSLQKLNAAFAYLQASPPAAGNFQNFTTTTIAIDTTISNAVALFADWTAASVSNQVTMQAWTVRILYPGTLVT